MKQNNMNKPVKPKLAKLLKDKDFNELCSSYYENEDINPIETYTMCSNKHIAPSCYCAPTISDVLVWLYDKHGIWISVEPFIKSKDRSLVYIYKIYKDGYIDTVLTNTNGFSLPTEAYEAAIEYVLENLIKINQSNGE